MGEAVWWRLLARLKDIRRVTKQNLRPPADGQTNSQYARFPPPQTKKINLTKFVRRRKALEYPLLTIWCCTHAALH